MLHVTAFDLATTIQVMELCDMAVPQCTAKEILVALRQVGAELLADATSGSFVAGDGSA